jgi:RNA polymerase sigma-70 factor (ECF subfamily)
MSQSIRIEGTDAELLSAVLDHGRVEAFAVLVGRYRDEYTRFAVRMLGNRDDADEALQSAFLRAYRALGQCADPDRFGAWLYQIVVNQCRTKAASRARHMKRFVRDEVALAGAVSVTSSVVDNDALRDEIQRAIAHLPVELREAFVLKHVEQLSYDEMAEITRVGVSALKMRVKRACERLRPLLEGVYHG